MVSIILKPLKLQIDCLVCSHTMHQLSGVWLHFYILWWIAKLRNSGNGKDIEYYQLERDCFVSFSCPWLDTSNQEGSILYLLCFLDQLVKLLIAKWNHHKTMFSSPSYILSMPKYTSMFIIWKKCRTHWFLSHFGKAVAVQPACHTIPEILIHCLLGPSLATANNKNSAHRKYLFIRPSGRP